MRVTAARLTPMARARSAREIGWWVRTRLRTMRLLISRLVPRVAIWKRDGVDAAHGYFVKRFDKIDDLHLTSQ